MIAYVTGNNAYFTTLRLHIDLGCLSLKPLSPSPSPLLGVTVAHLRQSNKHLHFLHLAFLVFTFLFYHFASIISLPDMRHVSCLMRFSLVSFFLLIFALSVSLNAFVYVCHSEYSNARKNHSYSFGYRGQRQDTHTHTH